MFATKWCLAEYLECSSTTKGSSSHGYCPACVRKLFPKGDEPRESRKMRDNTFARLRDLAKDESVETLRWMWSCDWLQRKKQDPNIARMCRQFNPNPATPKNYRGRDEQDIVRDIAEGRMEGLVYAT